MAKKAIEKYNLAYWDSDFTSKQSFGMQISVVRDVGDMFNYGVNHYRVQSTSGNTFFFMDGFEGLAEVFWGDREKMLQKLPFWEKLWYRAGGRFGIYRAVVTPDDNSQMSERKNGSYYQAEGYSFSFYGSVGLGRLGAIEYSRRYHLSGSFDNAPLNVSYLSYIKSWDF